MLDGAHFLLLLIVALIVLGPEELAVVLKAVGKGVGYLKKLTHEFYEYVESLDPKKPPRNR